MDRFEAPRAPCNPSPGYHQGPGLTLGGADDIRVNGIAPGAVLPPDDWPPERLDSLAQIAPLKRIGSPEDVAQAMLFFAGAEVVTGQILAIDGGRLLGSAGPPKE